MQEERQAQHGQWLAPDNSRTQCRSAFGDNGLCGSMRTTPGGVGGWGGCSACHRTMCMHTLRVLWPVAEGHTRAVASMQRPAGTWCSGAGRWRSCVPPGRSTTRAYAACQIVLRT